MKYLFKYILVLVLFLNHSPLRAAPERPSKDYNVILFFVDTLRADHLGCYGYPKATSPNIDKLAGESFVFKENFSTASYTISSFMSIITSLYPRSHGVLMINKDKLSSGVLTLAEILNIYGYKTAWLGSIVDPHLNPEAGFGRGFEELLDERSSHDIKKVRTRFLNWLEQNRDKRFFLNVHTYKVHSPYFPSPEYKERLTKTKSMEGVIDDKVLLFKRTIKAIKEGLRGGEAADLLDDKELFEEFLDSDAINGPDTTHTFFVSRGKLHKISAVTDHTYWSGINFTDPFVISYLQDLYDACILEYDEQMIAPVIEKLKELKIYDKTIIIICADHGEEFYEHGGYFHGDTLYGEVTYVPLIVRVPGKQGRQIRELTQNVDIMPTILDLLGIPVPRQAQGKSLVDLMDGKAAPRAHEYVFGESNGISSIRSKEWLFLLNNDSQKRELYHLYSDPREQKNVYLENKDAALKLESELKKWEASLPSYQDKEYPFDPGIDEAAQERIRKTGYW
ncbi:MAG: sulfatase [Candidatus Omnitrophica bacterium]|nr:sulfatase [Candidatus Omnitrophota bacterium]